MNGTLPILRVQKASWLAFYFIRVQWEVSYLYHGRGLSQWLDMVGALTSDFPPAELWERNFCLPSLFEFVIATQTDRERNLYGRHKTHDSWISAHHLSKYFHSGISVCSGVTGWKMAWGLSWQWLFILKCAQGNLQRYVLKIPLKLWAWNFFYWF